MGLILWKAALHSEGDGSRRKKGRAVIGKAYPQTVQEKHVLREAMRGA